MTDTPIADLVERMLAAGLPHASVVDSVRTIETLASRDASRSRHASSRSKDAERAARYRAKRKQTLAKANDVASVSSGVTPQRDASRDGVTNCCGLSSLTESVVEEEATKKTTGAVVVEGRASKRGTRIPEGWQPSAEVADFARTLGVDARALRDEFFDFWSAIPGSRGLKLDWDKTFKNRAREVAGRRNGRGAPPGRERPMTAIELELLNSQRNGQAHDDEPAEHRGAEQGDFLDLEPNPPGASH